MKYASHSNNIIFEGHDSDAVERAGFKKAGFTNYTILGTPDEDP
ncbi:hypothetical protein ACFL27_26625 [candidate division CSSED10-310 bacterium]|uniref:Uncharacterized protein n=1 Tax=candidate division CSSED10-310 bacterium TaxID=2855610 RepID=A0ABV6Z5R0_UNCC1